MGENSAKVVLDGGAESCDDARMNNDADRLRNAAAMLKVANRKNKVKIMLHRANRAEVAASLESIDHPHTFPTRYKYG